MSPHCLSETDLEGAASTTVTIRHGQLNVGQVNSTR
jgi:hypothetical protein